MIETFLFSWRGRRENREQWLLTLGRGTQKATSWKGGRPGLSPTSKNDSLQNRREEKNPHPAFRSRARKKPVSKGRTSENPGPKRYPHRPSDSRELGVDTQGHDGVKKPTKGSSARLCKVIQRGVCEDGPGPMTSTARGTGLMQTEKKCAMSRTEKLGRAMGKTKGPGNQWFC